MSVVIEMNCGEVEWTLEMADRLEELISMDTSYTPSPLDDFEFDGMMMCRRYAERIIGEIRCHLDETGETNER